MSLQRRGSADAPRGSSSLRSFLCSVVVYVSLMAAAEMAVRWVAPRLSETVRHQHAASVAGARFGPVYRQVLYRGPYDTLLEPRSCSNASNPKLAPDMSSGRPHKLVSVLLYMNEEDLMHVRLLEHYEAVDLFVVVEAPFTFTGNPKPLHFGEALCRRFERFADKIVHVVADFPDAVWKAQEIELYNRGTNDAWRREFAMRNAFHAVGPLLGLQPHDLVLQTDLDEIPTAGGLRAASTLLWGGLGRANASVRLPAINFNMSHRLYNLDIVSHDPEVADNHLRSRLFRYSALRACSMQSIQTWYLAKRRCDEMKNIFTLDDGIHASFFFPPEGIALKLSSFAHVEASGANFTALDAIKRRIRLVQDPRGEGWRLSRGGGPARDVALQRFTSAARAELLRLSQALRPAQA